MAGVRHGNCMGTAWARHGVCEIAFIFSKIAGSLLIDCGMIIVNRLQRVGGNINSYSSLVSISEGIVSRSYLRTNIALCTPFL
jgi:hypothetical protein